MNISLWKWNRYSLGVQATFHLTLSIPIDGPIVVSFNPGAHDKGRPRVAEFTQPNIRRHKLNNINYLAGILHCRYRFILTPWEGAV